MYVKYSYDECCGKIDLFRVQNGLYMSYHGGKVVRCITRRGFFLNNGRISDYFDTKYMTVFRIEQILHNFEDQKFANFLNLEQVNFRVTLVILHHHFRQTVASCLVLW